VIGHNAVWDFKISGQARIPLQNGGYA